MEEQVRTELNFIAHKKYPILNGFVMTLIETEKHINNNPQKYCNELYLEKLSDRHLKDQRYAFKMGMIFFILLALSIPYANGNVSDISILSFKISDIPIMVEILCFINGFLALTTVMAYLCFYYTQ